MKIVKTSDAKNNLSRHLEYVRRGGRVRILDRNTPVADLIPIETTTGAADSDEALLASLARRGLLRTGKPGPVPSDLLRAGPGRKRAEVVSALLEERRRSR